MLFWPLIIAADRLESASPRYVFVPCEEGEEDAVRGVAMSIGEVPGIT